jgi:hypothetical protein
VADSTRVDQTLSMARAHFRAPPAARERVRRELESGGHFDSGAANHGSDAAPLATRPLRVVAGVSKPAAALLAGLTFVAGYWLGGQRAGTPLPSTPVAPAVTAPDPAAPAPAPPEPAAPSRPMPEAPAESASTAPAAALPAEPSRGAARPPRPAPDKRRSSLGEELALLQRAEHAIRAGEPDLAMSFLDDLDQRHPRTRLGEERTAARLMARCARGDAGATKEAERFVRERRASVYSDRVRALCLLGTERSAPDTDRGEGD